MNKLESVSSDITTRIQGLLWSRKLFGINNKTLFNECITVESFLNEKYPKAESIDTYGSQTTLNFKSYNIFTFISPCFQQLYWKVRDTVIPYLQDEPYTINGWLNVFKKGTNINWHGHWPTNYRALHGFYCVNTEPDSFTEYKFPGSLHSKPEESAEKKIYRVDSENGLLVFGKSMDDEHRSSIWHDNLQPRITIAFDIIPTATILKYHKFHHNFYIPLKY